MAQNVLRVLLTAMTALFWVASPSHAQTTPLTTDLVNARIAALSQQQPPNTSLAEQYEAVKLKLEQATALERDAQQYAEALTRAPELEAEIQQRLDNLDGSYDAEAEVATIQEGDLQERLSSARAAREEFNTQISAMDRVLSARESRADSIRTRLAEINEQREKAEAPTPVDPIAQPSSAEADAWLATATSMQLAAEEKSLTTELDSQPARLNAILAQRAELVLEVDRVTALIAAISLRTQGAPERPDAKIDISVAKDDRLQGVISRLIEDHAQLTSQRIELNASLTEAQLQQDLLNTNTRSLDERFATAKRIVEYGADSEELGPLLFTFWVQIDDLTLADSGTDLGTAGSIVIRRIDHESRLAALVSTGAYVDGLIQDAGLQTALVSADVRTQMIDLVRAYREDLRDVISLESKYLATLSDLQARREALNAEIDQYGEYMQRLLLWIPNHPPLWTVNWATIDDELHMIAEQAREVRLGLGVPSLLALLVALGLFAWRQRFVDYQASMNQLVSRPRSDSIRYTLLALGVAVLRALPAPLILLAIAWLFERIPGAPDLQAMLLIPAGLWFSFSLMQIIGEPDGIAREHFEWQDNSMDRMRRELALLLRWWLPLAVLAGLANALTPGLGEEAIGRLTTAVALLIVAVYFGADIVRELRTSGSAWLQPMLNRVRLAFVFVLALILSATLSGRMFTVSILFTCVILSAWAGIALLLTHAILMRWLKVVRRRLRLNELLEQRAAPAVTESGTMEEGVRVDESAPALGDISNDTRQLLNLLTAVAGIAVALIIWEPLLPALDTLAEIELWSTSTEVQGELVQTDITLATVVLVLGLALVTLLAAKRLPALLEIVLRSRTTISTGASYTISTLFNYLIIGGGIIAAAAALGLQWSQLQWLVAALGVGIGFGLQEIVANFISGLIILFERPIRIGDVVTVGDKDGTVTKIRIRATTIRDWDGKELLVPNKEFITGRLLNWSLSDSQTRLVIPVGIAYGSDVEKALDMLRNIVTSHPNTLEDPEPLIVFENFGDNALELSARCFVDALEHRLRTMTDLRTAINTAFADAGIVIAYPQRDIHLDTTAPLRVSLEGPVGGDANDR
ncbi:MAG: mechanosensitive ion channel domain-containing protein [Pseudomonadota bacterium]